MQRLVLRIIVGIIVALSVTTSTHAGGWAVVTLDELPREVRAGETLVLGFMVRQHGVTPIGSSDSDSIKPYLIITPQHSTSTKAETIRIDARHEGAVGHFVADVMFSSAGVWEWEIVPAPFSGTVLDPLTVLPPDAASVEATSNGAFTMASLSTPRLLRWVGGLLVFVAIVLMVLQRLPTRRQRVLQTKP